jgi:hypothetical protein
MMISELLWVGRGPDDGTAEQYCASAGEAVTLIKQDIAAVVPTTDIAHQALLLLGSSNEWANFATRRGRYDFDADL